MQPGGLRNGVEACPHCDLTYDELRTGLTYSDVYEQFWIGSEDPSMWANKRRHTILGRWREIKLGMWQEHLEMCERQIEYYSNLATQNDADDFDDIFDLSYDEIDVEPPVPF